MKPAHEIITVVIPVFNRCDQVTETLDCVANQTMLPTLIIVDNNSTDSTLTVVQNWANNHRSNNFPITILSESKSGASAARNKGLNEVATPWTMFFDSDDIMLPNHVERLYHTIISNPNAELIGWDTEWRTLDKTTELLRFPTDNILWQSIFRSALSTQKYASTTQLFRQAGGWNENLPGWDDFELGMRLLLQNPTVIKINGAPNVQVRCQENSITGTSYSASIEKWELSLDCCEKIFLDADLPKAAQCINLKRAILAGLYRKEKSGHNYQRLIKTTESHEKSLFKRMLLRTAAIYVSLGGRGIHFLFRPIFYSERLK